MVIKWEEKLIYKFSSANNETEPDDWPFGQASLVETGLQTNGIFLIVADSATSSQFH